jgi:photosystem II stability/assembly factor-like uncharacterized protein
MKRLLPLLVVGLTILNSQAQSLSIQPLVTGTSASFRSLSVVSDDVVWVSGTLGTVAISVDGGKSWEVHTITGMEKADFRTLYAFSRQRALVANVGSPGKILLTEDGGVTWSTVYTNVHPDTFIDGIDFWNEQEGIVYGDPINGHLLMLHTRDGGKSWQELPTSPGVQPGEASFAASGTGIRCLDKSGILLCTGGTVSRLWYSNDKGSTWATLEPPLIQGKSSTGIFSIAAHERWVVVGGDFQDENLASKNHFYSDDQGATWHKPATGVRGYRECVEHLDDRNWIAVGPKGIDYSTDEGISWSGLSDITGLHVIRKARSGRGVYAAGANGSVLRLR